MSKEKKKETKNRAAYLEILAAEDLDVLAALLDLVGGERVAGDALVVHDDDVRVVEHVDEALLLAHELGHRRRLVQRRHAILERPIHHVSITLTSTTLVPRWEPMECFVFRLRSKPMTDSALGGHPNEFTVPMIGMQSSFTS